MANVSGLLQQARAAHARFHARHVHVGKGQWQAGSDAAGRAAIIDARTLRLEAEAADPEHTDPAWAEDRVSHAELVAFYDHYLATH